MTYGRGFGFRGSSPPRPDAGRGRGGLPRCWSPGFYGGYPVRGQISYAPQITKEQELGFLKEESNALRSQLEEIVSRITELEAGETQ
ncbi:DUF5320 domain-containing protein [Chloroflexota bacterium]